MIAPLFGKYLAWSSRDLTMPPSDRTEGIASYFMLGTARHHVARELALVAADVEALTGRMFQLTHARSHGIAKNLCLERFSLHRCGQQHHNLARRGLVERLIYDALHLLLIVHLVRHLDVRLVLEPDEEAMQSDTFALISAINLPLGTLTPYDTFLQTCP